MPDPYAAGLAMLARGELSAAQLRLRLERKGFGPDQIADALQRLQRSGALDEERTAQALARRSAHVRMHGRLRALREIEGRGISRALALRAVDAVYGELDEQDLLEQVLSRRLHGPLDSRAALRRVYQHLLRRGFDASAALSALKRHSAREMAADGD
ncbi:MAG: regulatory protein RecX [Acidobacteria bacterium]|nr:regulatory protein RecX [Acidobacteriota bacterium]